jgi:hypothetical protein
MISRSKTALSTLVIGLGPGAGDEWSAMFEEKVLDA